MLTVSDLAAGYGRLQVLHKIDLQVRPGQAVAVLGANGVGKTTLCRVLSGLVPAARGRIEVDGQDITRATTTSRVRRGIVQVPEGRQVFPEMTVLENLRLGAYVFGNASLDADLQKAWEMFPILRSRRDQRAGLLSGGEQQMLALARGMMAHPRYLLLDEPSQGLAPRVVEEIGEAIRRIAAEGSAVLLVEQNLFLAELVCERAFIIEAGVSVVDGDLETILDSTMIQDSYLGG